MKSLNSLRLVIIESPYEHWNRHELREWFGLAMQLKKDGFENGYVKDILPFDTTDFIATHLLLCDQENGQPRPLLTYKSVGLEPCRKFGIPFPALSLTKNAGAGTHESAVLGILDRMKESPERLFYNAGWTISPLAKNTPGMSERLKFAMLGIEFLFHRHRLPVEILSGGVVRFKVPESLGIYGFRPMTHEGAELPPIPVGYLGGENVKLVHLQEFTEDAKNASLFARAIWDKRLTVGGEIGDEIKKAA